MLYASCSNDILKTKKPSAKCGRLFIFRVIYYPLFSASFTVIVKVISFILVAE